MATLLSQGPRRPMPRLDATTAARRWSDGWRGGLLATCDFDLGFDGPAALAAVEGMAGDAALLIDPAAALLDPLLIDRIIEHSEAHAAQELVFAPVAPGLGGALVRLPLLKRLATADAHPGRLLHYHPDQLSREALATDSCVPVPPAMSRTTHSLSLSSDRRVQRIHGATGGPDAISPFPDSIDILRQLTTAPTDALPREVVLELCTDRLSSPIYWPGRHLPIRRETLDVNLARSLFAELATLDDTRLTLAGVGDPLLAPGVFDVIDAARAVGLAVHVETDLLSRDADAIRRLARSGADIVSVHLPALTEATYEMVMGVPQYQRAMGNIQVFVTERAALDRGTPLMVPLFTKCLQNLAEMEAWYDQWLRALGSAAIVGPSDYAGQVPSIGVADMTPPRRFPCARLASRLTILSDGRFVSCEQDIYGMQVLGQLGADSLRDIWQKRFERLREEHRACAWSKHPLCSTCREWHRS